MNATFAVRLLLLALLTGLGAGTAAMAQAQEKTPVASSATQKPKAAATKKTSAATNKAIAPQKAATQKKAQPKKTVPARKAATGKPRKVDNEVVKTHLPPPRLDLSLPQELVNKMQPVGKVPLSKSRPLLPQLFVEKPASQTPFQLNGRLLSNEMELQLRNDSRREIEGAALDFEFKQ
ncbi:hypothetical protein [Pseudomonas vanderleydeniana]|uniref:Translation initiation factor 2 n=1 Tax=Pseudomonas vanderleydeniana TaxID=2745495 RepID=A0A9E6TQZ0_9PSED|nr:hypothetical protein [Pseudomonas vanderleydeniana]QXI27011.1 hypothetical protein HU752_024285 [Pseudomonas vanderleydeniana]